ncbi:MAG: hypothetical protein P4K92_07990 [Candidatus Nitrosotalea sp.]|nr:hypothetical protein [Candidatus Nitrosotalea sp.]
MATRKGIIITVAMLAAISGASFVVWVLPQNHGSSPIVVSDFKSELDSVKERHLLITSTIESNLKALSDKSMTPDEFINQTQISSVQITSLTSELVESNAPTEWKQSYGAYFESLKKYNDYLTETISLANKMKSGISPSDLNDEMTKLDAIKKEADALVTKSDQTRP